VNVCEILDSMNKFLTKYVPFQLIKVGPATWTFKIFIATYLKVLIYGSCMLIRAQSVQFHLEVR
jgi:hypothetical protein